MPACWRAFLLKGITMHKLDHFINSLQLILDLRFLPDKLQKWLFSTGTRAIEVTSSLIMLGFSFVLFESNHSFFTADLYEKFEQIHPHALAIIMFAVAVAQTVAVFFKSARSNVLSGFTLLLSAFVWFVVFGLFAAAYPPLSTGIFTYLALSIVCALAGRALITRNRDVI